MRERETEREGNPIEKVFATNTEGRIENMIKRVPLETGDYS